MRRASRIAGPLLVVTTMAMGRPAVAQVDLSGEWAGTFYEDLPHRGGMQLGDYTGLPLNEAGWRKAQSWDESGRRDARTSVHHEHALQARGRHISLESDTVRWEVV